ERPSIPSRWLVERMGAVAAEVIKAGLIGWTSGEGKPHSGVANFLQCAARGLREEEQRNQRDGDSQQRQGNRRTVRVEMVVPDAFKAERNAAGKDLHRIAQP